MKRIGCVLLSILLSVLYSISFANGSSLQYETFEDGIETSETLIQGGGGTAGSTTYNLLDLTNTTIINSYIKWVDSVPILTYSQGAVSTLIIPVQAGKTYTVTRKNLTSRFQMGYGTEKWTDASNHRLLDGISHYEVDCSLNKLTLKAPAGSKYLYVFFYNGAYDNSYEDAIAEMMMVEGTEVKPYIPYAGKRSSFFDDGKKSIDAYNCTFSSDGEESKKRIFGVEFSNEIADPACDRIGDATLQTDFDKEFPWCEMRRCAITITNGNKSIIYEGETGFTVDGSAGNVMVEIPAFYVCRERIGDMERWMISGTHYDGFELHPWFVNADGTEVTHRYIGAYIASDEGNGIFSVSGSIPYSGQGHTVDYLADKMRLAGYNRHNIFALSAIQYLFTIEYATRDSQSIFTGSTYNMYMMPKDYEYQVIQSIEKNTLKLSIGSMMSGNSFLFYSVGMQVYIGNSYKDGFIRDITEIRHDDNNIYITVDGDPITLTEGLRCGGISQKNGKTDSLTTPSGYAPGMDSHVASFRYRGIENIWGSIWEILDGIKIKDGVYYISHDYREDDLTKWERITYPAPMINAPDHTAYNWIKSVGYDVNNRSIILPEVLFTDGGREEIIKTDNGKTIATVTIRGKKYFGDPFASREDTTTTYFPAIGGGWDHHENSGLFCFRFMTSTGGLYGERLTY